MSLPRYPKSKNSGVSWPREIPEHWEAMPIRRVARLESGHTPSRQHPEYWEQCTVPWFSLADIWQIRESGTDYIFETAEKVSDLGLANSAARVLPKGTVMLSRTASVGFSAIMGVDMATTQDFANWICGPRLLPEFLLQSLRSMQGEFRRLKMGSTHNTIYMPDIQALCVAVPPLKEQKMIAAFLARETAKIDVLMGEQRRLIDLLKEKRQAVISHAVTKGLNPHAPMKPSGIEWLGQVPAHWDCVRNKVVFKEVDERSTSDEGELMTVSHISGVTPRAEKQVNMFLAETLEGYKKCQRGDLVINTMWAWMGALGCSPCDGLVSPSYNVYRPRVIGGLSPTYYDDLCRIPSHRVAIKANSTGVWESRLRLYPNAFLSMRLAVPPLEEQHAITEYLAVETARWDALTVEAQRAIDLLIERRTVLISTAVTGKIDVRGLVGAEAA